MTEIRRVQPEASIIVTWRGPGTCEDEFVALAQRAVSRQADDPMSLTDMEKLLISATLRHTGGNIRESAAISRHRPLHSLREDQEVRYTEVATQLLCP